MSDAIVADLLALDTFDAECAKPIPTRKRKVAKGRATAAHAARALATGKTGTATPAPAPFEPASWNDNRTAMIDACGSVARFQTMHAYLASRADAGNEFFASLLTQLETKGRLSARQLDCVRTDFARNRAAPVTTVSAPVAAPVTVPGTDVGCTSGLFGHFAHVIASGNKRPRMTIGEVVITLAPSNGNNAGCLYVRLAGEYAGKITKGGRYFPARGADATDALRAMLVDLPAALTAHGHAVGACALCSRPLSNPESVERGIGPICADKWNV